MKKSLPKTDETFTQAPAYPPASLQLLNELRQRVALATGVERSYARIAQLVGIPKTTMTNWCTETPLAIQVLFGLLERLPEAEQHAFLQRHRRLCPTLSHASLTNEPANSELLRGLLEKKTGLTLLTADSPHTRSFLLHALGHCYPAVDSKQRAPGGLLICSPHCFVPIEGVFYFQPDHGLEVLKKEAERLWTTIRAVDTSLLLFDGVWEHLPELHRETLALSRTRHVIVAARPDFRIRIGAKNDLRRITATGKPTTTIQLQFR